MLATSDHAGGEPLLSSIEELLARIEADERDAEAEAAEELARVAFLRRFLGDSVADCYAQQVANQTAARRAGPVVVEIRPLRPRPPSLPEQGRGVTRSPRGPAAVDEQGMAGHHRSRVGGEESHDTRDLMRLADPVERRDPLDHVRLEGRIAQRVRGTVGAEECRRNAVHPYIVLAPFDGEALCHWEPQPC